MWHPFDLLSPGWRTLLVLLCLGAVIVFILQLRSFHDQIRGPNNERKGIAPFALAYSVCQAKGIAESWRTARAIDAVRASLRWDFGFILSYATVLSFIWSVTSHCFLHHYVLFGAKQRRREATLAKCFFFVAAFLSLGHWIAGLLDIIENCALLYMLETGVAAPWPQIAAIAAYPKFAILMVVGPPLLLISFLANVGLQVRRRGIDLDGQ